MLIIFYVSADYAMWIQPTLDDIKNTTLVNAEPSYYIIAKTLTINGIYQTPSIYQTVAFVTSQLNLTLIFFLATVLINMVLLWKAIENLK
jgi:hypothetical protein